MTNALTFVDTNILVYAHAAGEHDPSARKSRELLTDLWRSETGALSPQVLQEFYAVTTRKAKPPLTRETARRVVARYSEWCSVETDPLLIVSASKLEEDHTMAFWDALIIEAALRCGAERLWSEDLQHGRRFGELVIENPLLDRAP